jgi:hypothetical protein
MISYPKAIVWAGLLLSAAFSLYSAPSAQVLRGRVIDESGNPIDGAQVTLTRAALSTTSAADGTWSLAVPLGVRSSLMRRMLPSAVQKGQVLYFMVSDDASAVTASVYTLSGRLLYHAIQRKLSTGLYRCTPLNRYTETGMYTVRLQIGNGKTAHFRMPVITGTVRQEQVLTGTQEPVLSEYLEKRMVTIDTITASKAGYVTTAVPVTAYDDSLTITLPLFTPAYHLDPPNPCYNQFYVKDCIPGDPNSACGGDCIVANSCSPPEDPSKADLPKTFICPRFMLFSSAMLQAAKDDAALYGWGNGDEVPFNYGVVGHDADPGGLDDGNSSCCQCYQLIFEEPEPSSPQPPDLPYPKSLVVQSFNTAASGPKGFDVFMGAGGYGAFNSCYNDPGFNNTSNFDEFIYDNFPWQNPGGGGISFLRYEQECRDTWPPTVNGVNSSACQDKIEELCNQALANGSEEVTEDTRRSCIETNKVESLYHQNWKVLAKRVRCPENLTRVTGCRLKEESLPMPLPAVQTPAQARSNGSFSEGYHTTTMQDCCKPTCAWSDWVGGQNLPVDGEWSSFYSCDKNGVPITK